MSGEATARAMTAYCSYFGLLALKPVHREGEVSYVIQLIWRADKLAAFIGQHPTATYGGMVIP
jgi:hypothetical protein